MAFTEGVSKYTVDGSIVDLDATSETIEYALGTTVKGNTNTEWVYVQASGAIAQFDVVGIDENYQAAKITKAMADDGFNVGFAQVAFTDDYYGWVALRGTDIGMNVLASCASDVALYTSGTAGSLDDTSTSQTKIDGVVAVTSIGSAATSVEVIATYPKSTTF
jgi:hypothetical protein